MIPELVMGGLSLAGGLASSKSSKKAQKESETTNSLQNWQFYRQAFHQMSNFDRIRFQCPY